MPTRRTPHRRLKALRKIIECTQAKLAEKCGVSYPYLLSVETGQRPMSENLAKRISYATGVSKDWLMNAPGTKEVPQTHFGEYTKKTWEAHCRWEGDRWKEHDFGDVGDELMNSEQVLGEVGTLLRASWREGKFQVALLMLHDFAKSLEKELKLEEAFKAERANDVPHKIVDLQYDEDGNDWPCDNMLHHLTPLLSHYGIYKWAKAYSDGDKKRQRFIGELEDIVTLVNRSFAVDKE